MEGAMKEERVSVGRRIERLPDTRLQAWYATVITGLLAGGIH
jgi:hypothetical protein